MRIYRRGHDGQLGGYGVLELRVPSSPLFVPAQAVEVVGRLMRDHMDLASQYLAGRVAEFAPRNAGHLAQSFQANPSTAEGGIEITGIKPTDLTGRVFSTLPYALVMEEGRRPGFGISRAGMASLGLWVRRKLGLSGGEARSALDAIAWAIRQRGIKGTHYARHAFQASKPEIAQIFEVMNALMATELTRETGPGGAA